MIPRRDGHSELACRSIEFELMGATPFAEEFGEPNGALIHQPLLNPTCGEKAICKAILRAWRVRKQLPPRQGSDIPLRR